MPVVIHHDEKYWTVEELVEYCGMSIDSGPGSTQQVQLELDNLARSVYALLSQWGILTPDSDSLYVEPRIERKHLAQGFKMLVARLYRRRNSPGGIEALGDTGPVYISRRDPDIAMLLGLGEYTRPAVG